MVFSTVMGSPIDGYGFGDGQSYENGWELGVPPWIRKPLCGLLVENGANNPKSGIFCREDFDKNGAYKNWYCKPHFRDF